MSIKYSSQVTLEITRADNQITVLLSPDSDTAKDVVVYSYQAYADLNPGATIDLTSILGFAGGSGKLVFIGSNFAGPGHFTFSIKSDEGGSWSIDEGMDLWTSKQWTVDIEKV